MTGYTREQIIAAIQQATAHDGGKPVGRMRFETLTGITRRAWQGVYWARWSDALRDAGFEPNPVNQRTDPNEALKQVAVMVRRFGRIPVEEEVRVARRSDPTLPTRTTLRSLGGQRSGVLSSKLRELAESDPEYADLLDLLPEPVTSANGGENQDISVRPPPPVVTGYIYLQRMGTTKYYKVGKTKHVGKRNYELGLLLPEEPNVIHTLETDDPDGIETYWKERFKREGKHTRGEWFALSREDVTAFRRRGRFM